MSRADELRAALAVADQEEELAALKADPGTDPAVLEACKADLRYARWVHRGGPQEEADRLAAGDGHSNRAVAGLYARWLDENPEG